MTNHECAYLFFARLFFFGTLKPKKAGSSSRIPIRWKWSFRANGAYFMINLSDIYLTEYRIQKLNNEREYFKNLTEINDETKEIINNKLNNIPNKKKSCISNI